MADSTLESQFLQELSQSLADSGLSVLDGLPLNPSWLERFNFRLNTQTFSEAKIGAAHQRQRQEHIRSDSIAWLAKDHSVEVEIFGWLSRIRLHLNHELFLGLNNTEAHWAHYPPGSAYGKHLDQSPSSQDRVITFIHYLNEAWTPGDGGELEIFHGETEKSAAQIIEPRGGRWVFFRSEKFPHSVKCAQKSRKSLTGWFKVQDLSRV